MKKIIILTCIILVATVAGAQTVKDSWKQESRHELTLGFSDPLLQSFLYSVHWNWPSFQWQNDISIPENWFTKDCYVDRYGMVPPITLSYRYRLAKWFWIGGSVSYYGVYHTYRDRFSNEVVARTNMNLINISPTLHFSWLNRKYVSLYSGLSGGYSYYFSKIYSTQEEKILPLAQSYWNFQVTAIGIKAGKKWFGFAEAGIGTQSFITAGFGYRFNEND